MLTPHGAGGLDPMWPSGDASPMGGDCYSDFGVGNMQANMQEQQIAGCLGHAQQCQARIQQVSSRVQKLERSRGQISKDIGDMLKEAQEWRRVAEGGGKQRPDSPDAKASAEPLKLPLSRGLTAPQMSTGLATPVAQIQTSITPPPGLGMDQSHFAMPSEQLTVTTEEVDGGRKHIVKWRIDRVEQKLRESIGRSLVSQAFPVEEDTVKLSELRLMVTPSLGLDGGSTTMKAEKARYEAKVKERNLTGSVKLKVVNNFDDSLNVTFSLFAGSEKQGPLEHNFADRIMFGCDFTNNWLQDAENGVLVVGVEILSISAVPRGGPPPGISG